MKKIVLSLFLAVAGLSIAQSTGKLTYTMDVTSDNPEMAMAVGMMQGSKMDLSFIPGKSRMDMSMGSMMKMTTITEVKKDVSLLLMDIMGQKIATESKISSGEKEAASTPKPNVEKTSETKEIIGFKCQKTIIRTEDGNEMIMWTTKDITASLAGQKQFGSASFEGIPLEFSTEANGMSIHFVATKFDKVVDKKGFSTKIPEGYTVMTEEELQNMGGGM